MNASDLMTSDVVVVRSTDAIGAAVETLTELDIRHLPVVDDGELVGMLSDRDLRELGLAQINDVPDIDRIKALGKLAVADVMSSDVQTVDPGTSIRDIIDLMVTSKIGAVPVVEEHNGKLVGIVSYVDVLRAAASMLD
jgi:CBS domain-containing protein